MRCSQVRAAMLADPGLSGEGLPQPVQAHLRGCPACRREAQVLVSMRAALRQQGNVRCPVDLAPSVAARRAEGMVRRAYLSWPASWKRSLALGAAVAGLGIAVWSIPNHNAQPPAAGVPAVLPAETELVESYIEAYAQFRGTQSPGSRDGMGVVLAELHSQSEAEDEASVQ